MMRMGSLCKDALRWLQNICAPWAWDGRRCTIGVASVVIVAALCSATSADVLVAGGAGVFAPYNGSLGPAGLLQVLTTRDAWRFGGELEYRNYKSTIFHVDEVRFDSISLRGIVHYRLRPEGVSPYLGGGLGLNINVIDSTRVEHHSPTISNVSSVGTGIGLLGLAGVDVPLGDRSSLFGEARGGGDFQFTNTKSGGSDHIDVANLGGVSGLFGVRVRF